MPHTGAQRTTCTHRMISLVIVTVHLGVDSGVGEAQFPHLLRKKLYGLNSLKLHRHRLTLFPSVTQVTSSTLLKPFLLWPAREYNDYSCLCVFLSWTSLGDFPPFLFPCRRLFLSIEPGHQGQCRAREQEAKKRGVPGHPASRSCWPRTGQPQALQ